MTHPLISVIIPVYNVEKYVERCILSLKNQTYDNMEVILIDDGSWDESGKICDKYSEKYSLFTTYHKENGGLSSARNYGVDWANGSWIVFVDSDDYVEQNYILDLYELIESSKADIGVTRIVRESENGNRRLGQKKYEHFIVDSRTALFEIYSGRTVGWEAYGKIYKKELLIQNPFPPGYYEDFAIMYKIIADADNIAIGNNEENYHYITHKGSILTKELTENHLSIFGLCEKIERYINETYPEYEALSYLLYERAIIQLFNLHDLSNNQKQTIYEMVKGKCKKGLLPILRERGFTVESKIYAISLFWGVSAFNLITKIKSIRRM